MMSADSEQTPSQVICNRCKRRRALYLRISSGEALCVHCLRDEVMRQASRSLASAGLSLRATLLVPVSSFAPSASLLAAVLTASIEKRFKSRVLVAIPSFYEGLSSSFKLPEGLEGVTVDVKPWPPKEADIISCVRYDRAWSTRAARLIGADVVVAPLSRTDLTVLLLEALLRGRPDEVFDSQPTLSVLGVKHVEVFSRVEREALAATEFLEGLRLEPACRVLIRSKPVFMSVAGGPEMDYGALELSTKLAAEFKAPQLCMSCGAPSAGPICDHCASLGLDRISVSLVGQHPGQA